MMAIKRYGLAALIALLATAAQGEVVLFEDSFQGTLADGWEILREDPAGLRVEEGALRLRVAPGSMWGGANNAKNVLVRALPEVGEGALRIAATLENMPTSQYEQVNLVWYYDDSHMVKIGIERVHGQLSVVMGREEADKARTINIVPIVETCLEFRLTATGNVLRGEFRSSTSEWHLAGECTLPGNGGPPNASLQCYQGPNDAEHWAKIMAFRVTRPEQ